MSESQQQVMAERKVQIVFYTLEGAGATNACIGLAQALQRRGHQVSFFTTTLLKGRYHKLGFQELLLRKQNEATGTGNPNPAAQNIDRYRQSPNLLHLDPLKKLLRILEPSNSRFFGRFYSEIVETHEQIKDALETQRPDVIIVDHFLIPPCIVHGDIPWSFICCSNPLGLYSSKKLPPCFSGKCETNLILSAVFVNGKLVHRSHQR